MHTDAREFFVGGEFGGPARKGGVERLGIIFGDGGVAGVSIGNGGVV